MLKLKHAQFYRWETKLGSRTSRNTVKQPVFQNKRKNKIITLKFMKSETENMENLLFGAP